MNQALIWPSLREVDEPLTLPKGSAFRAFKKLLPELREGSDFRVLSPAEHGSEIRALREAGRIYNNSVNVVLLAPHTLPRVMAELTTR